MVPPFFFQSQFENNLSQYQAVKKDLSEIDPKMEEINLELNRLEFSQRGNLRLYFISLLLNKNQYLNV